MGFKTAVSLTCCPQPVCHCSSEMAAHTDDTSGNPKINVCVRVRVCVHAYMWYVCVA